MSRVLLRLPFLLGSLELLHEGTDVLLQLGPTRHTWVVVSCGFRCRKLKRLACGQCASQAGWLGKDHVGGARSDC